MAGGQDIRAGRAFMEIATRDKLTAGLKRAQRQLAAFGAGARAIGLQASVSIAAATVPLALGVVKAASDAQESISRFRQVFGKEADAAAGFAEDLASRVGRSALDIKDALATNQGFFVGLGFDPAKARRISEQVEEISLDLASFNNLSDQEGVERMISALSGSSEVLDRFGINTKQAALQQQLLEMGISKSWSTVTEQEKALARLNIITKSMGDQGALGDATRTAGSFANQLKRLGGETKDTAVAIGDALLPVASKLLSTTTMVVDALGEVLRENPGLVRTTFAVAGVAGAASVALLGLGVASGVTAAAIGGVVSVIGAASAVLGAVLSPIGLVTAAAVGMGSAIVYYSGLGGAAVQWLGEQFGGLLSRWQPVVEAIRTSLADGRLDAAAKVLWAGLRVTFEEGTLGLQAVWAGLKAGMLTAWGELWHGLQAVLEIGLFKIESAWTSVVHAIGVVWDRLFGTIKKAWDSVVTPAAKAILYVQGIFDDSIDVDAAFAELDRQAQAYQSGVDADVATGVAGRDAEAEDRQGKTDERHQEAMKGILRDADQAAEDAAAGVSESLTAAVERLRAARMELAQAMKAASSDAGAAGGSVVADLPGKQQTMLDGLGSAMRGAGLSSRGTFLASEVGDLGDRRMGELITVTKDIAETNKQIARAARSPGGGLTFS
jgi:hypothetical protein